VAAVQQTPILLVMLLKCVLLYLLFRNQFVICVGGPEQHVGLLVINYSIFASSCYHYICKRKFRTLNAIAVQITTRKFHYRLCLPSNRVASMVIITCL